MHEILERISQIGIVPLIAISDPDKAVPLAKPIRRKTQRSLFLGCIHPKKYSSTPIMLKRGL